MFGREKLYPLSIARDYVSAWGLAEAARELIQNALDSQSPFDYSFDREDDESFTFVLRSEFSKLEAKHLLLGMSSKAKDNEAIGSFGEGFKLALLVLTRLGFVVRIANDTVNWHPFFRLDRNFGHETLCIREDANPMPRGLEFMIAGLNEEDVAVIRQGCLKMRDDVGEVTKTTHGDILHDLPGEIYVGSLFIYKDEDLKFGYNFRPEDITLERDRQTVNNWDLKWQIAELWYAVGKPDVVAQMIYDNVPDLSHARYNNRAMIQDSVYELFKKLHPGALIAESPSEMKRMIEDGLTKTVYVGENTGSIIKSNPTYQADKLRIAPAPQSPQDFLASWGAAHKNGMDDLTFKHFKETVLFEASKWTHKAS